MALSELYKRIPLSQRICEGCGDPIQRNIAVLDGKLYHYGCLKRSRAKPVALCMNCWSYLTGKNIGKVTFNGHSTKTCGECGSINLRWLRTHRKWSEW